jgi:hypothetical protein
VQQLGRVEFAFFLPFGRHHDRVVVTANSLWDDELMSPNAEIHLPFSCLFSATAMTPFTHPRHPRTMV